MFGFPIVPMAKSMDLPGCPTQGPRGTRKIAAVFLAILGHMIMVTYGYHEISDQNIYPLVN